MACFLHDLNHPMQKQISIAKHKISPPNHLQMYMKTHKSQSKVSTHHDENGLTEYSGLDD